MPYIIYDQSFFRLLARRIAKRVRSEEQWRDFYFSTTRAVTQFELWVLFRQLVTYFGVSTAGLLHDYYRRAQELTVAEVEHDLLEIAAFRIGLQGRFAKKERLFPGNIVEHELVSTLYFSAFQALFEGEDFEQIFAEIEASSPALLAERVLRAATGGERWAAARNFQGKISVPALELICELMDILDEVEQLFLREFLE